MRLHTLSIVIEFFASNFFSNEIHCAHCAIFPPKNRIILSNLSKAVVSLNYLTYLLLNVI